jgi:hypothetical protein
MSENMDNVIQFEPKKEPISDAEFDMFVKALLGPYKGSPLTLE